MAVSTTIILLLSAIKFVWYYFWEFRIGSTDNPLNYISVFPDIRCRLGTVTRNSTLSWSLTGVKGLSYSDDLMKRIWKKQQSFNFQPYQNFNKLWSTRRDIAPSNLGPLLRRWVGTVCFILKASSQLKWQRLIFAGNPSPKSFSIFYSNRRKPEREGRWSCSLIIQLGMALKRIAAEKVTDGF